jgi:hypothetical protein
VLFIRDMLLQLGKLQSTCIIKNWARKSSHTLIGFFFCFSFYFGCRSFLNSCFWGVYRFTLHFSSLLFHSFRFLILLLFTLPLFFSCFIVYCCPVFLFSRVRFYLINPPPVLFEFLLITSIFYTFHPSRFTFYFERAAGRAGYLLYSCCDCIFCQRTLHVTFITQL